MDSPILVVRALLPADHLIANTADLERPGINAGTIFEEIRA